MSRRDATLAEPLAEANVRQVLETVVSPFHCLYQDALEFHTQSHLRFAHSEPEAGRLARAALLLYVSAAEALVHQAAAELGRPELSRLLCDPNRPLPLEDCWRLLPSIVGDGKHSFADPESPPWPQFGELLAVRRFWAYPGKEADRRAYYQRSSPEAGFEPLAVHQVPAALKLDREIIALPRTGLPRDPYALRPAHLDTARGILDTAIEALNRLMDGALTRGGRHRKEPIRIVYSSQGA
jgi:hypothetical protein